MQHHLNISTAAKMAGISRRQIQQEIKAGNLEVFEGDVSVNSLLKFYPQVRLENEKELDRVERIQNNAIFKIQADSIPSERVMADQVNRLQMKLQESQQKVREYENLLLETHSRLEAMQKDCDRKQKQTLTAFLGWMMGQYQRSHG
jgi:CDP-4-dehydro-6-deoxyglucose reductase, E3